MKKCTRKSSAAAKKSVAGARPGDGTDFSQGNDRNRENLFDSNVKGDKFFKAFQVNPVPMTISTVPGGVFVEVNEAFLRMFHYRTEDVIGKSSHELGIFHNPAQDDTIGSAVREKGAISNVDVMVRTGSGELRHGLFSAEVFQCNHTQLLISTMNDVTDRSRAELLLKESEERYRTAIENSNDGVAIVKGDRHIFVNKRFVKLFGYESKEEILNQPIYSNIHHEDREMVIEYNRKRHRGEEAPERYEVRGIRKDGSLVNIEISVARIVYENEFASLAYLRDRTEQRRAEEALKTSEEKYRSIFENTLEGMFQSTPGGRFITVNPAMAHSVGYDSPEEMIAGMTDIREQLYVRGEDRDYIENILSEEGILKNYECQFRRKDGTVAWFLLSARSVRDKNGTILFYEGHSRDITTRKEVEEALKASEERWKFALEGPGDGVWDWDVGTGKVFFSKRWKEMLGYEDHEIGNSITEWESRVHPEDIEYTYREIQRHFSGETPVYTSEHRLRCKDGTHRWILDRGMVVSRDKSGRPSRVIGTHTDITVRKDMEKALRQSEETVRLLINSINETLLLTEADGRIIIANETAAGRFGKSVPEIIGASQFDIVAPDVAERRKRLFDDVVRTGKPVHFEDERSGLSYEVFAYPARDAGGRVTKIAIFAKDITEKKDIEKILRKSEESLEKAQSIARVGNWEWDLKTDMVTASKEAFRIYGLDWQNCMDIEVFGEMVHRDDRVRYDDTILKWLEKGKGGDLEYRIQLPDGQIRTVYSQSEVVKDEEGRTVTLFGTIQDITERKTFENELLKAQKLQSVGILAGGIAHDFNNLLQAIVWYMDLAKMQLTGHDLVYRYLEDAGKTAMKASDLTKKLITFSKGGAPVRTLMPVRGLVEDTVSLSLSGSNVQPFLLFHDDICSVFIDEGQIRQVINNVIMNAKEAMPDGGIIKVEAKNTVLSDETIPDVKGGTYVQISFTDTGMGIAGENLSRVFDPYFSTKEMGLHQGMGLGLTVCYSIMKQHDGYITVQSEAGRGTKVDLYLPVPA